MPPISTIRVVPQPGTAEDRCHDEDGERAKAELARQRDYYHQLSNERAELIANREVAAAMRETLAAAEGEALRIGENIHDS